MFALLAQPHPKAPLPKVRLPRDPPTPTHTSASRVPKGFGLPTRYFLHLFSGILRPGDLQDFMERKCGQAHFRVRVLSLDVANDPRWRLGEGKKVSASGLP